MNLKRILVLLIIGFSTILFSQTEKIYKNSIGMEFVLINNGSFMMGSEKGKENKKDELPAHKVVIGKDFYLGKYEVTQGQWEAVMEKNPSEIKGKDLPVSNVSYLEIEEFLEKINTKKDGIYRLPTEAEWEYSCRAGTKTKYSFGDDSKKIGDFAWTHENSGDKSKPVGKKKPNNWGLYDMHGNVMEICSDWYGRDYYSENESLDPKGPKKGSLRILRGGCFGYSTYRLSSAYRITFSNKAGSDVFGFRLVKEIQ